MKRTLLSTLLLLSFLFTAALAQDAAPTENDYYPITDMQAPDGEIVEVGGIDIGPDGNVYACTRHGDVWRIRDAFGDAPKWNLFARYLHEPLGLSWHKGWLYATQRPEVTRMKDEDGDGRADVFECVSDGWGISGDYHEYAFGTRHDKNGDLWVVLCLTGSFSPNALYRGWVLRINENGNVTPTACGVRSPGGIGFGPDGKVYYCDNQGTWNGSSSMKHVAVGSFQGNPNGNVFFPFAKGAIGAEPPHPNYENEEDRTVKARERIPTYVPPAIVLPHGKMGQSPTGIETDHSGGKFGPFEGQIFIAEQTHSLVHRAYMEEVNGVMQGAAFPFRAGFKSGNIGLRISDDGAMFTGGSNRGWGARGGQKFNFERVNWTGKVPFEVHEMHVKKDGFALTFTKPIDTASAVDASFAMKAYTYQYKKGYGSPEVDMVTPTVKVAEVADDGKSLRLLVEPMTKGHVHELHLDGIKNVAGHKLLHDKAYYTLNEIPE